VHVDHSKSQPVDDKLSLKEACSLSRDLFHFWKISDDISKTVQDSLIVSIKFEQEVVCALSNGYVADDLGDPSHRKPPQFIHFALPYESS